MGASDPVHRLAYNGDVAVGQSAVFQGGPSRTGGKAPISGFIRVERATWKNSQPVAARRVALKMGRLRKRIGVSECRRVGVCKASSTSSRPPGHCSHVEKQSCFSKRRYANTPTRRHASPAGGPF
jgi:hypothetical protein